MNSNELYIRRITIDTPFDLSSVRNSDAYLRAIMQLISDNGDIPSLEIDGAFYLEFGDKDASHILYLGVCDLPIFLEPEGVDWKATRVYLANFEGHDKILERDLGAVLTPRNFLFFTSNECILTIVSSRATVAAFIRQCNSDTSHEFQGN